MSEFILPLIMLVIVAFWFVVAYLTRKTNPGSSKLAIRGGILAAVMFIALALIAALQVKITAVVAVPLFVAAIFEFAFIIALTSRTLNGRISHRTFMVGILTIIAAILIGVVLMFQPITPKPFNLGFPAAREGGTFNYRSNKTQCRTSFSAHPARDRGFLVCGGFPHAQDEPGDIRQPAVGGGGWQSSWPSGLAAIVAQDIKITAAVAVLVIRDDHHRIRLRHRPDIPHR